MGVERKKFFALRLADRVHSLTERRGRRKASFQVQRRLIKSSVVLQFADAFKVGLAHAEQSDEGCHDRTGIYLLFGTFADGFYVAETVLKSGAFQYIAYEPDAGNRRDSFVRQTIDNLVKAHFQHFRLCLFCCVYYSIKPEILKDLPHLLGEVFRGVFITVFHISIGFLTFEQFEFHGFRL